MLVGGIVAAVALAGPAWNRVELPVFRSDRAMVIALDLSRSMDAQDLTPSRLARARLKILDILERRASGQTALVVYSANAFTVTPLTTDATPSVRW
jgi:Ca-activated chloride channel homolog